MTPGGPGGEIMAAGQMDQVSPPYEPAPAPYQYSRPRHLASFFRALERRWFTVALAAGLLVTAAGIGLLYVDDTNNQARINSLTLQNESLTGRAQSLNDQLTVTQHQLDVSRGQVTQLETELEHPTLGIWNTQETLHGPNEWLSSTVPDTFTYHLKLKSSAQMDVSILDTEQFRRAVICMYDGQGSADYCLHHSNAAWSSLGVTSVSEDFPLAEGCAAYLAVISVPSGNVTITPDVTATYAPAPTATGSCK
jgi:hypothetical protein